MLEYLCNELIHLITTELGTQGLARLSLASPRFAYIPSRRETAARRIQAWYHKCKYRILLEEYIYDRSLFLKLVLYFCYHSRVTISTRVLVTAPERAAPAFVTLCDIMLTIHPDVYRIHITSDYEVLTAEIETIYGKTSHIDLKNIARIHYG